MRRVLFPLSIACFISANPAVAATYTTFAVLGFKSTQAVAINDAGTVTGGGYDSDNKFHSFVRTADGAVVGVYHNNVNGNARGFVRYPDGTFQDLDIGNHRVFPEAINEDGASAGSAQHNRGYFRSAAGVASYIQIKGMIDVMGYAITAAGDVVGVCYDENQNQHGFLWTAGKGATVFDVPGAKNTWANGASPNGKITGVYSNSDGSSGSFARTP